MNQGGRRSRAPTSMDENQMDDFFMTVGNTQKIAKN
jgi:hypothetical protein